MFEQLINGECRSSTFLKCFWINTGIKIKCQKEKTEEIKIEFCNKRSVAGEHSSKRENTWYQVDIEKKKKAFSFANVNKYSYYQRSGYIIKKTGCTFWSIFNIKLKQSLIRQQKIDS